MRSSFLGRTAVATALIFAIGACGDSGSGGPDFDDEATTEETEEAAYDAVELIEDLVDQLNFDGPDIALSSARTLAGLRARFGAQLGASRLPEQVSMPGLTFTAAGGIQISAPPGCTISSYGSDGDPWDWWDGNENGIADDWGIEYTCVSLDSSDVENVRTSTQSFKIRIKENTASLFGYHATQSYTSTSRWEDGDAYGGDFSMEETLDIRAGSADHSAKYEGSEWGESDGEREEYAAGASSSVSFDPDGTIAFESPLPDGDLTLNGRQYFAATDDVSLSFTLETTDPLAYESSCYGDTHPPFVDGTLVGRLNGRSSAATFEVNFNDCGDYDVDVDNTSDEPVVATRKAPPSERISIRRR